MSRAPSTVSRLSSYFDDTEVQRQLDIDDPISSFDAPQTARRQDLKNHFVCEAQFDALLCLAAGATAARPLVGSDEGTQQTLEDIFQQAAVGRQRELRMGANDDMFLVEVTVPFSKDQHETYLRLCKANAGQIEDLINAKREATWEDTAKFDRVWEAWQGHWQTRRSGSNLEDLEKFELLVLWNAFRYAPRGKRQQHSTSVKKYAIQTNYFEAQGG